MSNKALNWARKLPLKPGEQSVLNALADSYNDKKECCYLKIEHIMDWTGYSESTVKRHLASLKSKNLVQKSEVRNQFGHRITSKYTMIFDYTLNILGVILGCGKLGSLSVILTGLSVILTWPKCHFDTKDYIYNHNNNQEITMDNSLVDNFFEQQKQTEQPDEKQKIKFMLGIFFEQLRKANNDSYNLKNAEKLFYQICLENEHPLRFAENLVKVRESQINNFNIQTANGKIMPLPSSLFKWLDGRRWTDGAIKPLGEKKKVSSPYVKCACGEEMLRGQKHCSRCEGLTQRRTANA